MARRKNLIKEGFQLNLGVERVVTSGKWLQGSKI
jgi:hypothetical protein